MTPRIGIVNLMPHAEQFEQMLMPQFAAALPFEPVFVRMAGRNYSLDDKARIDRLYRPFDEVVADRLDGLVITGAAVEHLPYDQVRYLPELADMVKRCAHDGTPILGMCWGAMAVGHLLLDMPKREFGAKMFGAYETDLLVHDSPLVHGLDDRFWSTHSRFAGFDEDAVDEVAAAGRVRILARSPEAGTVIAESPDHSVVLHVGHPEYAGQRLADEYRRDLAKGDPIAPPANVDLERPVNQWRSHSLVFFANWTKLVHQIAGTS